MYFGYLLEPNTKHLEIFINGLLELCAFEDVEKSLHVCF